MRRKRIGLIIVASLCSWIIISYLLFVHCPNCSKNEEVIFIYIDYNMLNNNVNLKSVQKKKSKISFFLIFYRVMTIV